MSEKVIVLPEVVKNIDQVQKTDQKFVQLVKKTPSDSFFNIKSQNIELVFFQLAKQKNSLLNDDEKNPLKAVISGIFISMFLVTGANLYQMFFQPALKQKKIFLIFGGINLFITSALTVFGIKELGRIYDLHPAQKWKIIEDEKQKFNKMDFNQRKFFLLNKLQTQNNNSLQQKIQISK